MKPYSIVKIGSDYVVQADNKSIMKFASRRRAARLVVDAAGLLLEPAQEADDAVIGPSITRDTPEVA